MRRTPRRRPCGRARCARGSCRASFRAVLLAEPRLERGHGVAHFALALHGRVLVRLLDDALAVEVAAVPRPQAEVARSAEAVAYDLVRRRAGLVVRARAREAPLPRVRARGLRTAGFVRNPGLFFSLPLFSIGFKGECLFSPSLFFNEAVDNSQPVDNFSLLICFSFVFAHSGGFREIPRSTRRSGKIGKKNRPSGAMPKGLKWDVKTKKILRDKTEDIGSNLTDLLLRHYFLGASAAKSSSTALQLNTFSRTSCGT